MEQQQWICPTCSKVISPEDTFILDSGRFCSEHTVAECESCAKSYRITELASDPFSGGENICPQCRADLIGSVRAHLYNCSMLPGAVRQQSREARELAQRLVKRGRELADRADVLMRELEDALHALRETSIQESPQSSA
jgi:RNase P subunit RPR2